MPINRTGLAGRHTLLHLELQLLNPDANGKFYRRRFEGVPGLVYGSIRAAGISRSAGEASLKRQLWGAS
jgi:hypothetical protein